MPKAARIGDNHFCPDVTGGDPHVGGPVLAPGQPLVIIEGQVAARFTDIALCDGPIDAIAIGAPMVWTGGLLAARVGDASEHGGVITAGASEVEIGSGPPGVTMVRRGKVYVIVDRVNKTITLIGLQEFSGSGASADYVKKATDCINKTWGGTTTFEGETYKVNSMIQGRQRADDAAENPSCHQIDVKHTEDPPEVTQEEDPSHTWGTTSGYQHDTDTDGGNLTPAHEFGHSMGLGDEYERKSYLPWKPRETIPTGPPGGIMGSVDRGSKPHPGNFDSLITGKGLSWP
jgi:uncharacterized Zn-binding protein involved in type VI secretion